MRIQYCGDLLAPSGYARAIRANMRALIEAGVEIGGELHQHDQTQLDFKDDPFWGAGRMDAIMRDVQPAAIRIWQETPEFFVPDPLQYNIAYTVWETSKIIDHDIDDSPRNNWVNQLNRMDEVWTASEFCKKAFQDSGVKVPICVFPHPIDLDVYTNEGEKPRFVLGKEEVTDRMIFLSVFQFTKRKNPHDLLLAWSAEFAHQKDVVLVLKTYGSSFIDNEGVKKFLEGARLSCKIPDMVNNLAPILEKVNDADMPELFRAADAFVLPSYGEGFGMPYQEAMACGAPVIYTDASAMPEFCVGWPVECDPEPVYGMLHIPWYNATQDWWKVRVSSLRKQLRAAYDAWKRGTIKDLGAEARRKVEELHAFEKIGTGMRARLEEVLRNIKSRSCRPELADIWAD